MDRDALRDALTDADVPLLLMSLVHLTGDRRWIRPPYRPVRDSRLFADESGGLPDDVQEEVRAAALDVLASAPSPVDLDEEVLAEMMSVCVGEAVPAEYVPLMLEEMGFRPPPAPALTDPVEEDGFSVVVIGAGFSGICAAIMLAQAGIPYVVLEKNPDVGGTWLENTYPDAGVDTPNHFYSYSFAPKRDWQHYFSKQPQLLRYIHDTVDRHGVREHMRFGVDVRDATYDPATQRWTTTLADGEQLISNAVITAVGLLNQPRMPSLPGLEDFAGPLFHTARWTDDVDLSGKRVAMIGTGASSMQIAPTAAERAGHLTVFQRSAQWVVPNPDYHRAVSDRKQWLLEHVPFYASWYRFGLFWRYADSVHRHLQIDDDWSDPERSINARNEKHRVFLAAHIERSLEHRPDLLEKCMPTYPPYGKRMLIDNHWFETLTRDDVSLVDGEVVRIHPHGVETDDGRIHEVDVIIMATGFHADRMIWPLELVGAEGRSIHEVWDQDDPRLYLGITTPGFPNLFMLLGPGTAVGHGGSSLFAMEIQMRYIAQCLVHMIEQGIGAIEPRAEPTASYNRRFDAAHAQMVFSHPGMRNWYKNSNGRVTAIMPWRSVDYWEMTRRPQFDDFVLHRSARIPA